MIGSVDVRAGMAAGGEQLDGPRLSIGRAEIFQRASEIRGRLPSTSGMIEILDLWRDKLANSLMLQRDAQVDDLKIAKFFHADAFRSPV